MIKKHLFLVFLLSLYGILGYSQTKVKISGRIQNSETNELIPFVHINVIGSNYGTVSDENGEFVFLIPTQSMITIKVSSIGFESQTLTADADPLLIKLKPSTHLLKEVVVTVTSEDPKQIVKKAFNSIRRNYFREPIVLESFYRHYCNDDGVYGRLIEAQIDLYKKKGYGKIEKYESSKDAFEVKELRRSFDQTLRDKFGHQPMALDIVLKSDIASLKQKPRSKNKYVNMFLDYENFLNTKKNTFLYELEELTEINDEEVYKISFVLNKKHREASFNQMTYKGILYILKSNYVILRFESEAFTEKIKVKQVVNYKNYHGKYALFHSLNEISTSDKEGRRHFVHIDFTVENLKTEKLKEIKRDKIDRDYLSSIHYNEEFWKNYHFTISSPIPANISNDLQTKQKLHDQYKLVSDYEKSYARQVKADEKKLERVVAENLGILVIDLWASWCAPCIREYNASENNRAYLSEKGVQFLMVSIDENINMWRTIIETFEMSKENHARIGPNSTFLNSINMEGIPRFLIYHRQELVNGDAPLPHTQSFLDLVEQLLLTDNESNN